MQVFWSPCWSEIMRALSVRTVLLVAVVSLAWSTAAAQGSASAGQPPAPTQKQVGPSADTIQPYRPTGRDPFKKTVVKPSNPGKKASTPKAIGFPSLEQRRAKYQQQVIENRTLGRPEPDPMGQYLVNELEVLGFFRDEQGPGAFVRAQPTGTTFFIRRGAKCF